MQCFEWQSLISSTFLLQRSGESICNINQIITGQTPFGNTTVLGFRFPPELFVSLKNHLKFLIFLKIHHHVSISITIVSKLLEYVNISVLFMPNILSVSEVYKMYIFFVPEIRVRPSDKRYIYANESSNVSVAANQNHWRIVIILLEKG